MSIIEQKQEQIKKNGVRFKRTPQRLAIIEYLDGNTSHPSAEDIFRAVSFKYQSMSFATVYNTIHALTKAGALRELTIDPDRKRYDPDTSSHHHFICLNCGKIIDVPENIRIDLPTSMREDFTIVGNHVEFYGQCSSCKEKRKTS